MGLKADEMVGEFQFKVRLYTKRRIEGTGGTGMKISLAGVLVT